MARQTRPAARALRATVEVKQQSEGDKKPETIAVPAVLLLAAESIAAKADKEATELRGVMLHMRKEETGMGRVVATDRERLFVGAFGARPAASWLKVGIMLAQEDLKPRVAMLQKIAGSSLVHITFTKGEHVAMLHDPQGSMVFKVGVSPVTAFPDYEENIKAASFSDFDAATGETASRDEWKPIGFSSRHMKQCGDIAKILEAGIPKDQRDPMGMVVRMFAASETAPRVFDFTGWPGALLVMATTWPGQTALAPQTVAVLSGALKLTVAALRAHETRWRDAAAAAKSDEQRSLCDAKADQFRERVQRILASAPDPKLALAAPAAAAGAVEGPQEDRILTTAEKAAATRRRRAEERSATVH
jgi:hypothetical protein